MPEQGLYIRFVAAEAFKKHHWRRATAFLQDVMQKVPAGVSIEYAFFFKSAKGIGRQNFRPFVTVVAGGVPTGKDMRKTVGKAVKFGGCNERYFITHRIQNSLNINAFISSFV